MIISTKGRYGLRAMFALAQKSQQSPISIKVIANEENISEMYLEQLFKTLREAGLIKSVRGAQGGYVLACPPGQITVGEVLTALEGPLAPSDCVTDQNGCADAQGCAMRPIWSRIYDGINGVIDAITLQDMIDDFKND